MASKDLLEEVNLCAGCDWLHFDEKGMHFKFTGWLKDYLNDHDITCEGDLLYVVHNFPMVEGFTYCADSGDLLPFSLGLTDAPCWVYGYVDRYADVNDPDQPRYAWAFFERYQIADWVEELRNYGEVTFETFAELRDEEDAADPAVYENCLEA